MGTGYLIVNPAKRQFFDPPQFGDNGRNSGVLIGCHATALAFLVCQSNYPLRLGILQGSWVGDRVILAGDNSEPLEDFRTHASDEDRQHGDWYRLACNEFENISGKLIVLLADSDDEFLQSFVKHSHEAGEISLFLTLGDARFSLEHDPIYASGCRKIAVALNDVWGSKWVSHYKKQRAVGWRAPTGKST